MDWKHLILAVESTASEPTKSLLAGDLGVQVIATLISCALSAIIAFLVVKHELKQSHRQALHDRITHLLNIGIEHPYLEDSDWCSRFSMTLPDMEKRVRYELYCCAVFNLLEDVWKFCGGNRKNIRRFMHAEEYVLSHQQWWRLDPENEKAYEMGFRNFVQNILHVQGATR